jgi:predicted ATPase
MKLLGRRAECEALGGLFTDALAGHSRVIVLWGDAGVGKTALLRYLSDRRRGLVYRDRGRCRVGDGAGL